MTQTVVVAGISAVIGGVAYLFHLALKRAGLAKKGLATAAK